MLQDEKISTDTQRLAHILMWAELESIITSGPMRGKQSTYALLDERVAKTKELSREESLAKLVLKYFQGHGPAQVKDFAWWSGLPIKEANEGMSMIHSKLANETVNGKTYWFLKDMSIIQEIQTVFLLSVYDEYFIGYTDRSDILEETHKKTLPVGNALLTSLLIIEGKVAGTWKRSIRKSNVEFKVTSFKKINVKIKESVEEEAKKYATFFGYESTSITFE